MLYVLSLYRLVLLEADPIFVQTRLLHHVSLPRLQKYHQRTQVSLTFMALSGQISIG